MILLFNNIRKVIMLTSLQTHYNMDLHHVFYLALTTLVLNSKQSMGLSLIKVPDMH